MVEIIVRRVAGKGGSQREIYNIEVADYSQRGITNALEACKNCLLRNEEFTYYDPVKGKEPDPSSLACCDGMQLPSDSSSYARQRGLQVGVLEVQYPNFGTTDGEKRKELKEPLRRKIEAAAKCGFKFPQI